MLVWLEFLIYLASTIDLCIDRSDQLKETIVCRFVDEVDRVDHVPSLISTFQNLAVQQV